MKFGKTRQEKNIITQRKLKKRHDWKRWFAWYPVELIETGRYVWLEYVNTRDAGIVYKDHSYYHVLVAKNRVYTQNEVS